MIFEPEVMKILMVLEREDNEGKEALWTNSVFGGMPGYLISTRYNSNLLKKISALYNYF
ncbi:hypothetical protein ES703_48589 [subsurface metagenome]